MDGKATDFIIDDGELVPVKELYEIEDMEIGTVVLQPKDPEEFMKMMMALQGLSSLVSSQ